MKVNYSGQSTDYEYQEASSANYGKGRNRTKIDRIILHSMAGFMGGTRDFFKRPRPNNPTSAHYGIGWDGNVMQFVHDEDTAWHAGNGVMNLRSIGIEHEDLGQPYIQRSDALYLTSAHLVAYLCNTYGIPCDRDHVLTHNQVSDKATACPTGLDADRIVRMAHAIMHPAPAPQPAPAPAPVPQPQPQPEPTPSKTVHIVPDQGVNVRQNPSSTANIVQSLPKGTIVPVEQAVVGEKVDGVYPMWWKLVGGEFYIWAKLTSEQPTAPVGSVNEPTPAEDPAVLALKAEIVRLNTIITDQLKEITSLHAEAAKLTSDNAMLKEGMQNHMTVLNANKALSADNENLKAKLNQTEDQWYAAAFTGWELSQIDEGNSLSQRMSVAMKVLQLGGKQSYAVGWKAGAKVYTRKEAGNP